MSRGDSGKGRLSTWYLGANGWASPTEQALILAGAERHFLTNTALKEPENKYMIHKDCIQ